MSVALLSGYLSLKDNSLQEMADKNGWVVTGDRVQIQNQESTIKSKKILAKIEFDGESVIMYTVPEEVRQAWFNWC